MIIELAYKALCEFANLMMKIITLGCLSEYLYTRIFLREGVILINLHEEIWRCIKFNYLLLNHIQMLDMNIKTYSNFTVEIRKI